MGDPSLTAWLAATRAAHFASCLLIGGAWAFERLLARGVVPTRRLTLALLWVATPAALASGAAWLALVAADMSGLPVAEAIRPAVLGTVWSHTQFGRAWQAHAATWVAGVVALVAWTLTRRGGWLGLVASVGLVGGLAWAGHGGTGPAPRWHRAADVLHLLAAAVWPAGLVPFGLTLARLVRSPEPDHWHAAARLTRRFSAASLGAVAALTASGLVDGWCLVGTVGRLFTTDYGRVLLAKLAVFAAMVVLGAVNLLVLKPRLAAGRRVAGRWLRWTVAAEAVLAAAVLAVVGLLGQMEPAR